MKHIELVLNKEKLESVIINSLEREEFFLLSETIKFAFVSCLNKSASLYDCILNDFMADIKFEIIKTPSLAYGLGVSSFLNPLIVSVTLPVKVKRSKHDDDCELSLSICGGKTHFPTDKKSLKTQVNFQISNIITIPPLDIEVELSSACVKRLQAEFSPEELRLCDYDIFNCAHDEMTYVNKWSGLRNLCLCSQSLHEELLATHPQTKSDSSGRFMLSQLTILPRVGNICHLCVIKEFGTGESIKRYGVPSETLHYCFEYLANMRKSDSDWSWIYNNLAHLLGRPKWINEHKVFLCTKDIFLGERIIREASPTWLGKQRLDVYLPDLGIAIEYQGQQHSEAIDFFGGNDALNRAQERDARKLKLCNDNGVNMVYVHYYEKVSPSLMKRKLKKFIKMTS